MSDKHEPAFPATAPNGDVYSGMTLRDYFAAKAMQSLITGGGYGYRDLAAESYRIANAMLKLRDEP